MKQVEESALIATAIFWVVSVVLMLFGADTAAGILMAFFD